MSAPDPRMMNQLRHDVDDVYVLVDETNRTVSALAATQRRHGVRLEEIQQTLDLHGGRLDRLVEGQQQAAVRFDGIDGRLDGMDTRFDGMDTRFDRMEESQRQIIDLLRDGRGPEVRP